MTATTFLTQRQLMSKNMPADALTGPYAQQQKLLLYVLPLVFAVGGIAFPIGVLLYWTTSNLWTMGQQFYVIRNNPAPNTEAVGAKEQARRGEAQAQGPARDRAAAGAVVAETPRSPSARPRASSPRSSPGPSARRAGRRPQPSAAARSASEPAPQPTAVSTNPEQSGRHPMSEPMSETPERARDRGRRGDDPRRRGTRGRRRHRRGGHADRAGRPHRGRRGRRRLRRTTPTATRCRRGADGAASRRARLEQEGEIAADYLEELLEIADLDGDLDMDVEGDRATVSIVGADLPQLVGDQGEVLEALQELTRLAVYRETGERSRLMLDVSGHRADRRTALEKQAAEIVAQVQESGEQAVAGADVAVRAQGRARRRGRRRAEVGVRGRRAAPLRRGASRMTP